MKTLIEIENELSPIIDEIVTQAQETMPHPSGVDFVTHRYGEFDLITRLTTRAMEVVKKHLHVIGQKPQCVKKLKVVWGNWHHDFAVTGQPANADGVMVVHVTDESMHELLNADRQDDRKAGCLDSDCIGEMHGCTSNCPDYQKPQCICGKYNHPEFLGGWICPVHGLKSNVKPYDPTLGPQGAPLPKNMPRG